MGFIALTILPLPAVADLSTSTFSDVSSFMLYASSLLGYLGIVLLLWMYVLGTKSVIGLYFRDMASIMKLHKWLGKYGVLFIFAHPLAAALAYGQNVVLYSLLPDFSSNYETYVTWGRVALYGLLLVWLTSAIVRSKIAYRPWLYIHYVAYIVLPLSLLHTPIIGTAFGTEKLAQFYFYVAIGTWVIFSILRLRHLFMLGKLRYSVTSQVAVTPDVVYLTLMPNQPMRLTSNKGQFLYLQMNLMGEGHPFSVLQRSETTGALTVAYKKFGRFTHKLSTQPVGTTLFVDGPYGVFTDELRQLEGKPAVFIAGGIGITPFVEHVLSGTTSEQWLFYGNKTKESSAFATNLQQKLGDRFVPVLSNDASATETGYMRAELFAKYLPDPTRYHYFICGPHAMMEAAVQALLTLDVPASAIHTEEFNY